MPATPDPRALCECVRLQAEAIDLDTFNPKDFQKKQVVCLVMATFGEGEPTDNAKMCVCVCVLRRKLFLSVSFGVKLTLCAVTFGAYRASLAPPGTPACAHVGTRPKACYLHLIISPANSRAHTLPALPLQAL